MTEPQQTAALPILTATLPDDKTDPSITNATTVTHAHLEEEEEEIVVDWDGPDDPGNPKTWSYKRKWGATITVSLFLLMSPISSDILAPAGSALGEDLGIHSQVLLAMTVSVFILAYAVGPLLFGPLSEIYGRQKILQFGNLFYLVWNLACGFAQNQQQLLAFRFLSGIGGSAPVAAGGGTLADLWRPEERGKAVSIYVLAPLLGPVVGPIAGGWIAEKTTWRWAFWAICIADLIVQGLGLLFLTETYPPVLLERRAKALRKSLDLEKGSRRVRTVYEKAEARDWKSIFGKALSRPFALFIYEPVVQVIGVYTAFTYGILYLFFTTIPRIFAEVYHFDSGITGLHYIALGVGLVAAAQGNAHYMDKIYVRLKESHGGVGRPEFRVPTMIPGSIIFPIGILIAGWCADAGVHWIGLDVGLALVGCGMILVSQNMQAYIVDCFALYAASAIAAVNCLRSLAGFGFPLFAPAMYAKLGYGKGATILAVVAIVIGCPAPFAFWKYGERLREKSRHARK
ncbi:MFS polyamine transporter [Hymenopellis radicata]|nr:MFS polyamine transporter [Hymenopellis radicata]